MLTVTWAPLPLAFTATMAGVLAAAEVISAAVAMARSLVATLTATLAKILPGGAIMALPLSTTLGTALPIGLLARPVALRMRRSVTTYFAAAPSTTAGCFTTPTRTTTVDAPLATRAPASVMTALASRTVTTTVPTATSAITTAGRPVSTTTLFTAALAAFTRTGRRRADRKLRQRGDWQRTAKQTLNVP
jgi:hypothetical protein